MEQRQAITRITLMILLVASAPASPESHAALQIKKEIKETVLESLAIFFDNFDPSKLKVGFEPSLNHVKFNACDKKLTLKPFKKVPLGRKVVNVSCASDSPWALYVPIHVSYKHQVLVFSNSLANTQVVSAFDIQLAERDLGMLKQGFYVTSEDVVGKEVRRQINPGTVVTANLLQPAEVIQRGDTVSIQANQGSLKVSMSGEALIDGRVGQQISVRNHSSKRIIKAVVVEPGLVEIP